MKFQLFSELVIIYPNYTERAKLFVEARNKFKDYKIDIEETDIDKYLMKESYRLKKYGDLIDLLYYGLNPTPLILSAKSDPSINENLKFTKILFSKLIEPDSFIIEKIINIMDFYIQDKSLENSQEIIIQHDDGRHKIIINGHGLLNILQQKIMISDASTQKVTINLIDNLVKKSLGQNQALHLNDSYKKLLNLRNDTLSGAVAGVSESRRLTFGSLQKSILR